MFFSFCIITTGQKEDKTKLCIKSIHNNFVSDDNYEIIIVGNNIEKFSNENVKLIEDNEFIEFLGARKNIGTQNSKGDVIVHIDDDVLFPPNWVDNFLKFNEKNPEWQIMGNKFLLPDGGRHWDRATYYPQHVMVPYDYESDTDTFYQSGGFCVCKKTLLSQISWKDYLPYYAMFKGFKHNEDVDFSIRLKEAGIKIYFDRDNTVWHYDHSYKSNGLTCNKKQDQNEVEYNCLEFLMLLNSLKNEKA